jgi:hypothetical protein
MCNSVSFFLLFNDMSDQISKISTFHVVCSLLNSIEIDLNHCSTKLSMSVNIFKFTIFTTIASCNLYLWFCWLFVLLSLWFSRVPSCYPKPRRCGRAVTREDAMSGRRALATVFVHDLNVHMVLMHEGSTPVCWSKLKLCNCTQGSQENVASPSIACNSVLICFLYFSFFS